MRSHGLATLAFLGLSLAACSDVTSPADRPSAPADARSAVQAGEKFSRIAITNPSATTYSLALGSSKQMYGTLYYSLGGTLASQPYASWSSSDPCVAKVTSAYPSWGKVVPVAPGKARIIATVWGKADTVTVTVTGTGAPDPACYAHLWTFDTQDVSFTGTPATSYSVKAGETLSKLVLFAPKSAVAVGRTYTLVSEMWYSGGGKLNGVPYVNFTSTDGSVATVDAQKGIVTARAAGRTKMIVRLGTSAADTIPLYVQ